MANEGAVTARLIFDTGQVSADFSADSLSIDVSGDDYTKTNMSVGTGASSLVTGGVSALGGIMVGRVKPGGGTVTFYIDTQTEFLKYNSGDPFIVRFAAGSAILVKSSTSAEIEYLLLEA
tara:strand:- start:252 stop:611 length:360 start_codon:yes stop_codon:yes gene_type:complete